MTNEKITATLNKLLLVDDISEIKKTCTQLQSKLKEEFLQNELQQIIETKTIERSKYYIKRLIKAINQTKTSKINDINLNRWKEYNDIITDSLWILNKRDTTGAHNANYWGNFVPQIPHQFLSRYTQKDDWVLDAFLGSGTTLIESKRLGRNAIGVELLPNVVELAQGNISKEPNPYDVQTHIVNADCTTLNYVDTLQKLHVKSVQLVMMHPPYWDIIKFSDNKNDLSNEKTLDAFLAKMKQLAQATYKVLDKGRYCILVISDKYENSEWIPLAHYTMQEFLKLGYSLKSTIIKNFDETKGKMNQQELWRYRALVGGFYIFKHEYIFVFKK